jgi:hypothetical protein
VTTKEQEQVKRRATELLRSLWRQRSQIWSTPRTVDQLLPIPTHVIARHLLRITIEEPETIPVHSSSDFQTAGYMDRSERRIVVAQNFRPEWRRFTMAHEIAHWVLHPAITLHRDRPLSGGERANRGRPREEQEADLFAAELLMPAKVLKEKFGDAFGLQIDLTDPVTISRLSIGVGRELNDYEFASNLRYRSMVIAGARSFTNRFAPLASTFGVSPTAMAIQLEDLGLVI